MAKDLAIVPIEVVTAILANAGEDLILVGGQSLALWMNRYGVRMPAEFAYVSRDIDFLTRSITDTASVRRLAETLGGRCAFPTKRVAAFTALVGQAIRELPDGRVYNIDVMHKMWGAGDDVWSRAVLTGEPPNRFRVLHPLDVLKSRLDNLHGLKEKQTELGHAQLVAAIGVGRGFLREAASLESKEVKRPLTLRYVSFIEKLATADAGKKVAARYGIHVADAIEPGAVRNREFHEKRLPQLVALMSPARRKEISGGA